MNDPRIVSADPEKIFKTAESFFNVCRTIKLSVRDGNPLPIREMSLATISALTLEEYLKCLRTIEFNCFITGHDIDKQLSDLLPETRAEIERRHSEAETRDPNFVERRLSGAKTDLQTLLNRGKTAFVKFRYPFESYPNENEIEWGLDALMLITRDIIVERRPQWEPEGYHRYQYTFLYP